MAQTAAAAFARIRRESRFNPAMSTTEYIIVMSLIPTYGRVSPEASVETMTFGKPTGNARMADVPMVVPAEPPIEMTP
jgi:hypothetical protein